MKNFINFFKIIALISMLLFSVSCKSDIVSEQTDNTSTSQATTEVVVSTTVSAELTEDQAPPYLYLNERLYRLSKTTPLSELNLSELRKLGEIKETISGYYVPEENFTANFAYEGAEIYYWDDESVLVPLYYIWDGDNNLVESEKPWACVCKIE